MYSPCLSFFSSGLHKVSHEYDPALECTLELEDTPEIPLKHLTFMCPHMLKRCAHATPELTHDSASRSHTKNGFELHMYLLIPRLTHSHLDVCVHRACSFPAEPTSVFTPTSKTHLQVPKKQMATEKGNREAERTALLLPFCPEAK